MHINTKKHNDCSVNMTTSECYWVGLLACPSMAFIWVKAMIFFPSDFLAIFEN